LSFFINVYTLLKKPEDYVFVGIIYSTEKNVIEKVAEGLKSGIEKQGKEVRLYPDNSEKVSGLPACKLILVGTYAPTLFKVKTPSRLKSMLDRAGGLAGKRSIAFTSDTGSRGRKALFAVMKEMEKQGCVVIDQLTLRNEKEAYQYGANLKMRD
jgi:flavorubredoxin